MTLTISDGFLQTDVARLSLPVELLRLCGPPSLYQSTSKQVNIVCRGSDPSSQAKQSSASARRRISWSLVQCMTCLGNLWLVLKGNQSSKGQGHCVGTSKNRHTQIAFEREEMRDVSLTFKGQRAASCSRDHNGCSHKRELCLRSDG